MSNVLYTARAHNVGGRDGRATAEDGFPDVVIKPPKELGGPDDVEATNPEELFALGYGACFLSALSFAARRQKISAKAFEIHSVVNLLGEEDGSFAIGVELHATIPGVEGEKAHELLHQAHRGCPYSKASRGNIEVKLFHDEHEV